MNKTKRYAFDIPKASSERMNKEPKILVLTKSDGWGFCTETQYALDPKTDYIELDIEDEFIDFLKNEWIDGPTFRVKVIYYNSTKKRKEEIRLIPKEIKVYEKTR